MASAFLFPIFRKDGDAMSQDEKTKAAFKRIEQGVKDVYSSENFKQYLSCVRVRRKSPKSVSRKQPILVKRKSP